MSTLAPTVPPTVATDKRTVTTVCISSQVNSSCMPWVSAFSSEEAACAFRQKIEEKLDNYGVSDLFLITTDSGPLDDEEYLEWIDAEFGE